MKKLIVTPRGHISHIDNIVGLENLFKHNDILLCNWPFAFGFIPVPNVNKNIFTDAFNWSINSGFIEEDASIHAAMYAYGFCDEKNIEDSILFPSDIPKLIDFSNKNILSLSIEDFRNNLSESLLTFTFPSACKYIAGVYPIVDSLELLQQMFDSGAKIIQLRLKRNIQTNLNTMVKNACKLSLNYPNSKLFINDHWELAIENDAYGVHLGQEDLLNADIKAISNSGLHLGLSTHSYWEVSRAYRYKPSYIACGPIYPTKIKKMPWKNQGIQNLKYWARVLDIPTIGIGGINFDNLQKVKSTKCSGVSIINAIINSENPIQSFKILESSWKKKFR